MGHSLSSRRSRRSDLSLLESKGAKSRTLSLTRRSGVRKPAVKRSSTLTSGWKRFVNADPSWGASYPC